MNVLTRASMDECMSVNFYSFIELVRQATKQKYRADKMSIVAVSSVASIYPKKCQTIYAASKAAVNIAVQSLAIELVAKGIRLNSIVCGAVDTKMAQEWKETRDTVSGTSNRQQTLGIVKPEQVASSIMYLLSDASSAMTGRYIYADNGVIF